MSEANDKNPQLSMELRSWTQWALLLPQLEQVYKISPKRLKRYVSLGIPDAFRGAAWQRLARLSCHQKDSLEEETSLLDKSPNARRQIYFDCLTSPETESEIDVMRDVSRTFPLHLLFREKGGLGQEQIFNVLKSVAVRHSNVGYCQGMGFITGFLLMFMTEVDTFIMLDVLLTSFELSGLFEPDLPALPLRFYQLDKLMQLHLPDVRARFTEEQVHPSMFASQWILTLFACSFPFKVLARIWDVFFMDGFKMLFRVAIALMKIARQDLLQLSFEQILTKLKSLPFEVNVDILIETALSIKITRHQLTELATNYSASLPSRHNELNHH